MLTPEQIQSFEDRAAAGEMPTPGMWGCGFSEGVMDDGGDPGATCYSCCGHTVIHDGTPAPDEEDGELSDSPYCTLFCDSGDYYFRSRIAAQLAAEHLLRESTTPLHQSRIDKLETIINGILECNTESNFPDGIVDTDNSDDHLYQSKKLRTALTEARAYFEEQGKGESTAPLHNRWIPVAEEMPKPVQVLAHFTNSMGNGRTIHAVYIPRWHMEQDVESDWFEYNEEKDEYYWPEGWYEVSECNDEWGYTFVDEKVTHWMPMPDSPCIDDPETRAELQRELDEHWKGIDGDE